MKGRTSEHSLQLPECQRALYTWPVPLLRPSRQENKEGRVSRAAFLPSPGLVDANLSLGGLAGQAVYGCSGPSVCWMPTVHPALCWGGGNTREMTLSPCPQGSHSLAWNTEWTSRKPTSEELCMRHRLSDLQMSEAWEMEEAGRSTHRKASEGNEVFSMAWGLSRTSRREKERWEKKGSEERKNFFIKSLEQND